MTVQEITSFGPAIDHVKAGFTATRMGWDGDFLWLKVFDDGDFSKQSIYITYGLSGESEYWTPEQEDLLADDWVCL